MIRPQTCAVCGKELSLESGCKSDLFPFCSGRCRDIDLYRWCEGRYTIVKPLEPEDMATEFGPDSDMPVN